MAYIVLALGAVMVLAGSYEVYFGNIYIVVERGWSAFISGTVLLTGGLVTIALGLAIRALVDLKDVLIRQATVVPAHPDRATVAAATHAPVPAPAPDGATLERSDRAVLFDMPMPEPAASLSAKSIPGERPHAEHAAAAVLPTASEHEHGRPDAERRPAPPLAADLFQSAPLFDDLRTPTAHEEVQPDDATELSPAMDDWLDRNFADLARGAGTHANTDTPPVDLPSPHAALPDPVALVEIERPATTPEPHEEPVSWRDRIMPKRAKTPAPAVPELEPTHMQDVEHALGPEHVPEFENVPEPEHLLAPEPLDEAEHAPSHPHESEHATEAHVLQEAIPVPEPSPAVIGRYEAEGTSYVMYADGSIEAQSDAGIYRFASMAELKVFIEG